MVYSMSDNTYVKKGRVTMLYPIGVQSFEKIRDRKYVYIDKTAFIYKLVQSNICFLARPRRFGKSLLISTLEAYFLGRKELFQGLKIEKLEKEWIEYPVFHIDFAGANFNDADELNNKLEKYLGLWEKLYGKEEYNKTFSDRFQHVIEAAHKQTGQKVVVLVDEYDKPLLDVLGDELEVTHRNILKGFYGTFKSADDHLRFVFLTGVTKFSQVSVFSDLNQLDDISMESDYDAICGVTEEELDKYFKQPIEEMSVEYQCTVEEMKTILKKQYDGYHFSEAMLDIYNPFSIINAFKKKKILNYWYRTGTPTYLVKLLDGHYVNMKELTEQAYTAEYFIDYRADKENPLAMLYQSGYLTIKDCDLRRFMYRLDYPNDEVKSGFVSLMANSYFKMRQAESEN